MSDELATTWPIMPHTKAKHAILKRYLDAWLPILSKQSAKMQSRGKTATQRVLYVDGFAGPGIYDGGEPGSPVIAVRAATRHTQRFPFPIEMVFIEERADRHQRLTEVLAAEMQQLPQVQNVQPLQPMRGDCDTVLTAMLDDHQRAGLHFGPALAFLDQFGYGAVSMDLIRRVLSIPHCEVFTYLDYKDMNRWISDPDKAVAFDRAFGGSEWRDCIDLPESGRRSGLLERYKSALRQRGCARYVTAFSMFDRNGTPLYWLLFCTNSLRGLEEMKKAMWHVDGTGEFRFSDRDNPAQLPLLDVGFDEDWLADELLLKLARKVISVADIKEFVLTETPCYLFKAALKKLECGRKSVQVAAAPVDRRPGTYPDESINDIRLKFPASLLVP